METSVQFFSHVFFIFFATGMIAFIPKYMVLELIQNMNKYYKSILSQLYKNHMF